MKYSVVLDPRAIDDIQKAIDYYEGQRPGLGRKFEEKLHTTFSTLERNPNFQVRFDDVRCLPVPRYPFMIHFTINEPLQKVVVWAVFHTSINPDIWKSRK
jgi:toxin ParE1/3/4